MARRTYIITYDLAGGGDYEALADAIKAYGTWAHLTESTWAVRAEATATVIRDDLLPYLTEGSRLLVVRSGTEAAWWRPLCKSAWLKKNL